MLSGFFLPLSTAVVKGFLALSASFGAINPALSTWRVAFSHPLSLASLSFFAILAFGVIYSSAPLGDALRMLSKYKELLYLPFLLLLFTQPLAQRWGERFFFIGLSLTVLFSYLGTFDLIVVNPDNPGIPSKNRITQGLLLALGVYLALHKLRYHSSYKIYYGLFILLAVLNILFIADGRSGYVVLVVLVLLWVWQSPRPQRIMRLFGSLALLLSAFVIAYQFSSALQLRFDESINALFYPNGEIDSSQLRLEFLHNSWQLLQQQTWWGSGTGSFAHEYRLAFADSWTVASHNPHNEYIHLWIQLGFLGLLLLPVFLWLIWQHAHHLPRQQADKIQALVLMLALGCVFNSLLLDFTEISVFMYLLAHNLAGTLRQ